MGRGELCSPSSVLSMTFLFPFTTRRKPIISHKPWWVFGRCCHLHWSKTCSSAFLIMVMDLVRIMVWLILDQVKGSFVMCCRCQAKQHTWRNVQMESIKRLLLISWAGIYLIIGTLVKLESTVIIVFHGLTACLKVYAEIVSWGCYSLTSCSFFFFKIPIFIFELSFHFNTLIRATLYRAGINLYVLIILPSFSCHSKPILFFVEHKRWVSEEYPCHSFQYHESEWGDDMTKV